MRAQAAVEYMAMIGVLLAILLPLAAYVWKNNSSNTAVQQATITADKIANTADGLWAQGPGAKNRISVYFPPGYNATGSSLSNHTIRININTGSGRNDVVSTTKANITGTLPTGPGNAYLDMQIISNWVSVTPVS